MKNLFLVSSFKDVVNIFADRYPELSGKRVTFIPTASVVEKVNFYVKAGRKALEKLGLVVEELELSTASADEIKAKLIGNDLIYVSGGNSFFLLQELKRTGADQIIRDEVATGKLYIGESAGAIVAAPNIEYIKKMDSIKKAPELTDCDALKLVDFYPVPHQNEFPFKQAVEKIIAEFSESLNLLPINNHEAIVVTNDEHSVEPN